MLTACALVLQFRGKHHWAGFRAFAPLWLFIAIGLTVHVVVAPPFGYRLGYTTVALARWVLIGLTAALAYDFAASPVWRARMRHTLTLSAIVVALLGLGQYYGLFTARFPEYPDYAQPMYSVFGNQDLLGGYLAIGFALLMYAALVKQGPSNLALVGLLPVAWALALSGSRSAWLAAAVGTALTLPHVAWRTKRTAGLGAAMVVGAVLLSIFAAGSTSDRLLLTFTANDHGGRLRLLFWAAGWRMFLSAPWLGVGPGQYQFHSPQFQADVLHGPGGRTYDHNQVHTLYAHCDPLEWIAEWGVLGAVCMAWMGLRLVRCRGPEWGGLAALTTFAALNFPSQSFPHAAAGAILAAVLLARSNPSERSALTRSRSAALAPTLICYGVCIYLLVALVLPSHALQVTNRSQNETPVGSVYTYRAKSAPWSAARAYLRGGILRLDADQPEEARAYFHRARRGLDTGDVYLALGVIEARLGNQVEAAQWLDACLRRWPANLTAWRWRMAVATAEEREQLRLRAQQWLEWDPYQELFPEARLMTL
jgi:O-antigen ligase